MARTTTLTFAILFTSACADVGTDPVDEDRPNEVVYRDRVYTRADRVDADGIARLPDQVDTSSLATRTRDELAELWRVTLLHPNGGAYTTETPNWEAADAALALTETIDRIPKDDDGRGGVVRRAAQSDHLERGAIDGTIDPDLGGGPRVVENLIGSDGRALSPSTANPFNAIARVDVFTAGAGAFRISCTGSWVGRWTFLLAGHCMRFTDGTFARRIVIESARAGSSLPFGRLDCNNADSITSNNFTAAVPTGYSGTLDNALDFAVIDVFPCQTSGLPATRTFNGYTVNAGTTTYNMHGYPLGRCPSASAEGTFMCGMADGGYVNDWRLESQLDGTDGQDGAPWFTIDPTRVAGVHNGYREYFDLGRCGFDVCRRQYARRIDGAMDTFIRNNSFDF